MTTATTEKIPDKSEKKPSAYVTGHCGNGNHEGTKNLSPGGALYVACAGEYYLRANTYRCMCTCHEEMRAVMEMMRAAGKLSSPGPSVPMSTPQEPVNVEAMTVSVASPATAPVHTTAVSTTRGGRVERGNLEQFVWEVVCDALDKNADPTNGQITPSWIKFEVRLRSGGVYDPSAGAIHAVTERWAKHGMCVVNIKPYRVISMNDRLRLLGPTRLREERDAAAKRAMRGH